MLSVSFPVTIIHTLRLSEHKQENVFMDFPKGELKTDNKLYAFLTAIIKS